jgi:Kef-type K+ transport system membrane component KefB
MELFIQLGILLVSAFVLSYLAKLLKQPIIIGYIIAGILISPLLIKVGASTDVIKNLSELGIAFLLFVVGLHLNPKVIKEIGVSSLVIGLGQIILTFGVGFVVSFLVLGWGIIPSLYVGIALSFSSTIIVMKLLSDKQHLDSLYGKISIGILIMQDIVAICALVFISSFSGEKSLADFALRSLLGGFLLVGILLLAGIFVLPRLTKNIAKSQELLFLFSIAWCFLIASAFFLLGFSVEIGALIAGMVLSVSPYNAEMSAKVRPLRDFFLIIFFIILGFNINFSEIRLVVISALILSVIALILKPLFLMVIMRYFGYTKRTNFLVGTTLGQISEFSLIVLIMGVSQGVISEMILNTMVLTLVLTILFSTYMIIYSRWIYEKLSGALSIFERKKIKEKNLLEKSYDAMLFGYNRIGFNILNSLKTSNQNYLVIDFNPDTIANLQKFSIPCLYGDVDDSEFLDELPLKKIKLAISTIPEFETNSLLIEQIRDANPKAIIIGRAHTIKEALDLYKIGADYVLTPHFLGGEYVAKMIGEYKTTGSKYQEEKEKHIKMLESMFKQGHEHPSVEKN